MLQPEHENTGYWVGWSPPNKTDEGQTLARAHRSLALAGSIYPFTTDLQGNLIQDLQWPLPYTLSEQAGNFIEENDTTFIGMFMSKILGISDNVPGDFGLLSYTVEDGILWKRTYGQNGRRETPQRVRKVQNGGFVMVGQASLGIGSNAEADVYLVRLNSLGEFLWDRLFGGIDYDAGNDLLQTPDSGFLLLGWTRSYGAGQRDFYLVKTDSLGNEEWYQTYGGSGNEGGYSILALANGNYLLTGGGTEDGLTSMGYLYEVSPSGQQVWHNTYGSGNVPMDVFYKSIQLADGSIISAGLAQNSSTGGNAGWLHKVTSNGAVVWNRVFDKNDNTDLFYSVLATDDGGFLLSGQAINEATNSQDAWLLKVDSVGCPYPNCTVGIDEAEPTKVVVDVWPNPVAEQLNIKWQNNGLGEVRLFDLTGKEALRKLTKETRESIDVSNLPNGLYLLTLIQGEAKTNLKIVVQR